MALPTLASAVALPEILPVHGPPHETTSQAIGEESKKRKADSSPRADAKRTRRSPGKPPEPQDAEFQLKQAGDNFAATVQAGEEVRAAGYGRPKHEPDPKEHRRKSSVVIDEKKRGKRLFGALLGNLGAPSSSDRAAKRRAEIEDRKKAELARQEEEHRSATERRLERLGDVRRREQSKVDEQNMRIRHGNTLNMANFLQTTTEPKLYYLPWELRPEEEDRIRQQAEEAQARVDNELDERRAQLVTGAEGDNADQVTESANETADDTAPAADGARAGKDEAQAKSIAPDAAESTTAAQEEITNYDPTHSAREAKRTQRRQSLDETEDVTGDGDEDTVIY